MRARTPLSVLLLLAVLTCSTLVRALFADDAFVVDWHIESTGALTADRTFVSADSIAVFSESSVLASLNPSNGSVRWRHLLIDNALAAHSHLVRLDSAALLVAAATPADQSITYLSAWVEDSGYLLWEAYLPHGAPVGLSVLGDVYLYLSNGKVLRISRRTGIVRWEFDLEDGHSPVDILATSGGIAVVTRVQGKGLGYFVLDAKTGELSGTSYQVLDKNPAAIGVSKVPGSVANLLSWTYPGESKVIKLAKISGPAFDAYSITPNSPYTSYVLSTSTDVLLVDVTGESGSWSEIYIFGDGGLDVVEIGSSSNQVTHAVSDSTVFEIADSLIYNTKRTKGSKEIVEKAEIAPLPAAVEFVKCGSQSCFLGLKNGENVFVSFDGTSWTRDESIADPIAVLFVDLEVVGESSAIGEILYEENAAPLQAYIHRVRRHYHDLSGLPQYILGFFNRFFTGNYEAVPVSANSTISDTFGFRKFIVLATHRGGLRALDTAHGGAIAWKVDDVIASDTIAGVMQGNSKEELYVIGAFGTVATINALTGRVVSSSKVDIGLGDKIASVIGFAVDGVKYIGAWTAHGELHFLNGVAPTKPVFFSKVIDDTVKGFVYKDGLLTPTWTFALPTSTYKITSVATRSPEDKTVSIGRVLGDRSVLYKYLNPSLVAIATVDPATKSAALFVIDDVSGRLLYSAFHDNEVVDTSAGVKVAVGESFVVYSYWSELAARGEKVVVLDLYESDIKNDRWSNKANYSSFENTPLPFVQSQAYVFQQHITSLAVSHSRFGITSRDIIATLGTGQIAVMPKRLLDARRPVNRDPSAEEKEEMLMRYEPYIADDRRAVISHVRQVMGAKATVCSPAYLESTVLVFTYGLDLFFTRITPSQPFDILPKSFNRAQLLLTIMALIVGVRIAGPLVKRKQLNFRWGKQN